MEWFLTRKRLIYISLFISISFFISCLSSDKFATRLINFHLFDFSRPSNISITINNGESFTSSKVIKVRITARDNIGIVGYYLSDISNQPKPTSMGWINISPASALSVNKSYLLQKTETPEIDQLTLFVWFKDAAGNVSKENTASISYLL